MAKSLRSSTSIQWGQWSGTKKLETNQSTIGSFIMVYRLLLLGFPWNAEHYHSRSTCVRKPYIKKTGLISNLTSKLGSTDPPATRPSPKYITPYVSHHFNPIHYKITSHQLPDSIIAINSLLQLRTSEVTYRICLG